LRGYDNDLEKYLSALYARNSDDNLFGNFLRYLEDIFFFSSSEITTGEANHYRALLNLMWGLHGKKHWSCLTFNYDTLLEQSYLIMGRDTTGRDFNDLSSYQEGNPVILKMHGGINYRYQFSKEYRDEDSKKYSPHFIFSKMMAEKAHSDEFIELISLGKIKPSLHTVTNRRDEKGIVRSFSLFNFPLMLIPIHASITPENMFFREQISHAVEQVKKANFILVIGYNFGDETFTTGLAGLDITGKEIVLVTSNPPAEPEEHIAYKRLRKTWPQAKIRIFDGEGFGELIEAVS
jgi:hypothetical protein